MRKKTIRFAMIGLAILLILGISSNRRGEVLEASSSVNPSARQIIIDPGHGGEDGGATGVSGKLESGLNLEISLRLRALLRLLGYEPIMTRESDVSIYSQGARTLSEKKVSDLHNRAALMGQTPEAVVLSIHQNIYPEAKYKGVQVFYAPTEGSQQLAENMQAQWIEALDSTNQRAAKKVDQSVYLLNHIDNTAVLIECGFLSNPEEEQKLCTEEYQKKVAAVIAAVTLQFLEGTNEV